MVGWLLTCVAHPKHLIPSYAMCECDGLEIILFSSRDLGLLPHSTLVPVGSCIARSRTSESSVYTHLIEHWMKQQSLFNTLALSGICRIS